MLNLSLLMGVSLLTFAHAASAGPAPGTIRWVEDQNAIVHEFCTTSWPLDSDTCLSPRRPTAIFEFPEELGRMVESHIRVAAEHHYFDELSMNDFFHGHLILRGPQTTFRSPEELFQNVSYVLYHTAEYSSRWENQADLGVPPEQRTPRSLLGYLDGTLVPAQSLVHADSVSYQHSGTIYTDQVIKALPGSSTLDYGTFGAVPTIYVHAGDASPAHLCQADSLEFYLLPRPDGAFRAPDGRALTIFLRCVQNSEGADLTYSMVPRQ